MWLSNVLLVLAIFVPLIGALGFCGRNHGFKHRNFMEKPTFQNNAKFQLFSQKLDHFNKSDDTVWKQRYLQNDTFYNKDKEIQFLYIGGEGEIRSWDLEVQIDPMNVWGEKFQARMWEVEHRFYGKSRPKEDLSIENLKYLSGKQALEDVANFIRTKNKELKLKNPKWVTFGCSYAASLALWSRLKYPDLITGAFGSSGPVNFTVDFTDYNKVTEKWYHEYDPKCADAIGASIKKVELMIETKEGQKQLDELLHLDPKLSEQKNLDNMQIWNLFDAFGNGLSQQMSFLKNVCDIMRNEKLDLVTRLYKAVKKSSDLGFVSIDYYGDVEKLRNTSYGGEGGTKDGAGRRWLWQQCTEYGWFQTTSERGGIFGKSVPIDYYYNQCMDVFGKNEKDIKEGIKKSNEFYGNADDYNATNVFIGLGTADPWSPLGLHKSKNPSMITFLVEGGGHCGDTDMGDDVPKAVKEAQKIAFENIQKWIQ